ncbi:MAG TPA: sigma-70 family RNA polymerase sigma factor [Clostridia bacterium]|nr:sigma-70 family RNA polymerase sigma factor [Clostridia bacterium]
MERDEATLIARSQQGDVEAFGELVALYERQVYTIAYRFMGNPEDASDLAQEAFVRAFRAVKSFRGEASFKTWLYHIIANVCRDELRKRKKQVVVSLDAPIMTDDGFITREQDDWSLAPERVYESIELQETIQKLLNQLTPEYRQVLVLREIQGFTYEEIAQILACSLGTVKSRINRARKAMRDLIAANKELFQSTSRLVE